MRTSARRRSRCLRLLREILAELSPQGQPQRLPGHQRRQPHTGSPAAKVQTERLSNRQVEPAREWASPDDEVIFTEQAGRLSQVLAELPEEQREVVLLRLTADMKFRDIAKLQQVSINTVQGRYRYGLDRLRSMLNGEVEK